jgi:hypothetical protein
MPVGTTAACFITHKTAILPLKNVSFVRTYRSEVDYAVMCKPTIASALTIRLDFVFVKENININPYNDSYINPSM